MAGYIISRNAYKYDRQIDVIDGDGNRRTYSSVEAYEAGRAAQRRSDPEAMGRQVEDDRRAALHVRERRKRILDELL